jgi:signal transduction histidine kinase
VLKDLNLYHEGTVRYLIRLLIPLIASLLLFAYLFFQVIIPKISDALMENKRQKIMEMTMIGMNVLEDSFMLEKSGKLSRAEAQKHAIGEIGRFRYGTEMKDYFWVINMDGVMLWHPYSKEIINVNMLEWEKKNNSTVTSTILAAARKYGSGFVNFVWQYYDNRDKKLGKICYMSTFKPWNWVIGTGLYEDDIKQQINNFKNRISAFFLVILVLVSLISFYMLYQNIKDRKKQLEMHNHIIQNAKLASLGTLAATVAHELNNPLTILMGYLQILKDSSFNVEKPMEIVDRSLLACERMHKLIDNLRTFARESKKEDWNSVNINVVIENTIMIMDSKLKKHSITVTPSLDNNIETIWGEITQLESVFQNLISNSIDAFDNHINDNRKKEIKITSTETIKGKELVIIYRDNAGGMKKEVQEHIFDPFFTTKAAGKGTGLGMSIAREILEKHNAHIKVQCEEGVGTDFTLTFKVDTKLS